MRPLALTTRCQGTLAAVCLSTVPTSRARRGRPATRAVSPYGLTLAQGMRRIVARMSFSGSATVSRGIASSDRQAIVNGFLRAVRAVRIAPPLAAAQRDPDAGHERQHTLEKIAGRIGHRMEDADEQE